MYTASKIQDETSIHDMIALNNRSFALAGSKGLYVLSLSEDLKLLSID
jgi:hypothetical protein